MKYNASDLLSSMTIAYKDGTARPIITESHKYEQSNIRAWYDLLAQANGKTYQVAPYDTYFLFECLEMFAAEKEIIPDLLKDTDWIITLGLGEVSYSDVERSINQVKDRQLANKWMYSNSFNENEIKAYGARNFLNKILRYTLQVVYDNCE